MNVGPALSPDGTRIAFLSERDQLSIDLYLADATTGRIISKLVETASDPHFESLQFLASAGAWDPKGTRLAIAAIRGGKPVIAIIDGNDGDVMQEVKFDDARRNLPADAGRRTATRSRSRRRPAATPICSSTTWRPRRRSG